jgi:hypothetical protein
VTFLAFTVAAIITLSLTTGPWPPLLLALALLCLAAIIALCVAGLIMQGKEYGREQRIERAARLAEMERWFDSEVEAEG